MLFTCKLGLHQHHSEDKANQCETCADGTRRYFKVISDAELIAQGVTPLPRDCRGDGTLIKMSENGINAPRKWGHPRAV